MRGSLVDPSPPSVLTPNAICGANYPCVQVEYFKKNPYTQSEATGDLLILGDAPGMMKKKASVDAIAEEPEEDFGEADGFGGTGSASLHVSVQERPGSETRLWAFLMFCLPCCGRMGS